MVLTPGGVHAHDGQALVEHAHDQGADHGAGDGADAAGDGRAADEAGRDGVHLELMPGLSR